MQGRVSRGTLLVLLICVSPLAATVPAIAAPGDVTAVRVADIAPGAPGGMAGSAQLVNVGGTLYFAADDGVNGVELWKSDGTSTTMVEDGVPGGGISPLSGSSTPEALINVGGTLFFTAEQGTTGRELWKTDGGTATMIEDAVPGGGINPVAASSSPAFLTDFGGTLFFTADDGTNGRELWKTDGGTAAMIEDAVAGGGINPGDGSFPGGLTSAGGTLFFQANDGTNGEELWRTSGGTATMIEDALPGGGINPGGGGSSPQLLRNVGGTLYFAAIDGANGSELWLSDGTSATMVEDAVPGDGINPTGDATPGELTNVEGILYFAANDGTNGRELWRADGPSATMIEDAVPNGGINPGGNAFPDDLTSFAGAPGTVFFTADDGSNGLELWRTDGGTATMIEDAIPGGGINPSLDSFPSSLRSVAATLFFAADDGTNGMELWQTGGGTATMIEDAVPGSGINAGSDGSFPGGITEAGGSVFFIAWGDFSDLGRELWRIDGGIAKVIEDAVSGNGINPSGDSSPGNLTNVAGTLFFAAIDGSTGRELWKTVVEGAAPPVDPVTPASPQKQVKKCKQKKRPKGKDGGQAAAKKKCKKKRK